MISIVFKSVNDTYGHDLGDYVLKVIADIVRSNTRKFSDLVRWGGDEFVIVAIETSREGTLILSERVRKVVENFNFEKAGKITASFGVTQLKDDDTEATFIKRLDEALYKAKKNGGNRVEDGLTNL